jgi:hypothetical protein
MKRPRLTRFKTGIIRNLIKLAFFGYFSEVMLIFGVKRGFAGHLVEFGQNRQEKTG